MINHTVYNPETELKDIKFIYSSFMLKDTLEEINIKFAILKDRKKFYDKQADIKDFVSQDTMEKYKKYIEYIKDEIENKEKNTTPHNVNTHQQYNPNYRNNILTEYTEHGEYYD